MTLALEVKNLSVSYPNSGVPVLENLNFTLAGESINLLIGPNGSGKTTLIKAILGLLPYQGEIFVFGRPVIESYGSIGFVEQRFSFDTTFPITVKEFVQMPHRSGRTQSQLSEKELEETLQKINALEFKNQPISHLSGGQLQRILLARALAAGPKFLILDEPESNLDIHAEGTIYGLIFELVKEKKITVLIASHELDVVSKFADQVICLNRQIVCHGVPEQVLNKETLEKLYGRDIKLYAHKH